MVPEATSTVNTLGLAFIFVTGALILLLPRRYALLPVVIVTCFMTLGQVVLVAGLHFTMIRILTMFGWIRLLVRGEIRSLKLNAIDKALLGWTLAAIVTHTILWQTSDEFVNRLGLAYNALGMYFLFRFVIRDLSDITRVFKITAVLIVPLAAAMVVENATGRNVFAVFGGVQAVTAVRDGVVRCQGPFAHPILAGTFGASLLPFFVALWGQGRGYRFIAAAAVISSTIITITSGSSGAVMTYIAGVVGLGMWFLRKQMRVIRWGLLTAVIGLQLVMKAPVWFLMQRVNIFSGSTGDHRAYLIDRFVANLGGWWLVGTKSSVDWGDENLWDITNQYILEGVNGGLLTMLLFIFIIVCCFAGVGRAVRRLGPNLFREQFLVWALGAALFAHTVSYFSISYFDQNVVNWYLLLAMISTGATIRKPAPLAVPTVEEPGLLPGKPDSFAPIFEDLRY